MSTIDGEDSEKLLSLNVAVWEAEDKLDAAKKVASRAAADLKVATLRLRKFKGELKETHPLFDAHEPRPVPAAATPPAKADVDGWRDFEVNELLDLSADQLDALAFREIETLGQLADFLGEDGFRGLQHGEVKLSFEDSAKVLAAFALWWEGEGDGPFPVRDDGDCPSDRARTKSLVGWLKRCRDGERSPQWGEWSEFTVNLEDGREVAVRYEPPSGTGTAGHLAFRGPVTETGYYSHHLHVGENNGVTLRDHAEALARKYHAETSREAARTEKKARPKAAPKRKGKGKAQVGLIEPDLEAVLAAESDADAETDAPLWAKLGIASLRVPGPVHGKLLNAGLRTFDQLPELLATHSDKRLSALWDVTIQEAEAVRASFMAIANPKQLASA